MNAASNAERTDAKHANQYCAPNVYTWKEPRPLIYMWEDSLYALTILSQ